MTKNVSSSATTVIPTTTQKDDTMPLTHEQVAEISRLASLWATARVRKALVSHGCGAPTENHLQVGERERNANSELHEYLRTLLPHNRSSLNDITRNP